MDRHIAVRARSTAAASGTVFARNQQHLTLANRMDRHVTDSTCLAIPPPTICVVVHDAAPATWAVCRRLIAAIDDVTRLPLTLLAVPRYHCGPRQPAFEAWLRARASQGDEIALHGYTHQDDGTPRGWLDALRRRHYTRGEGEFCDLSCAEAQQRLLAGWHWFREMGLPLHGFVAPAWLLGPGAWRALAGFSFDYTCTIGRVWRLPEGTFTSSQSLVYSSQTAWRRTASRAWNSTLAKRLSRRALVRLELHPSDALDPTLRRSWQALLERMLRGRDPTTLMGWVERWQRAEVLGRSASVRGQQPASG